jgi:hypothetical protein
MPAITRRALIAQTATMAAGVSALASSAPSQPNAAASATVDVMAKRRETLEELLKILPRRRTEFNGGRINAYDKSWEDWLKRTGELPPDFDAQPSKPFLVDPLEDVRTLEQWEQKRRKIRALYEQWVFGKMPPQPDNLRGVITRRTSLMVSVPPVSLFWNSVRITVPSCMCS